jgi:hypothetical protein
MFRPLGPVSRLNELHRLATRVFRVRIICVAAPDPGSARKRLRRTPLPSGLKRHAEFGSGLNFTGLSSRYRLHWVRQMESHPSPSASQKRYRTDVGRHVSWGVAKQKLSTSTTRGKNETNKSSETLFGEPPLLAGESKEIRGEPFKIGSLPLSHPEQTVPRRVSTISVPVAPGKRSSDRQHRIARCRFSAISCNSRPTPSPVTVAP